LLLIELQREVRELTAFGVEQSELRRTEGFDVPIPVENGEGITVLEHTCAVVRQRGRGSHVVFICDLDNVSQNEAVLVGEHRVDLARLRGKRPSAQNRLI
jgi:hypothetical protein